jgi:hypothetical protein
MTNRWLSSADAPRGDDYDAKFTALERAGEDVHGEADFVASLGCRACSMPAVGPVESLSSWPVAALTS